MTVRYRTDLKPDVAAFRDLLGRSTLGERRPVGDQAALAAMLEHANLVVTAWTGECAEARLVGIARSLTDFAYCCYLSDLAVDAALQRGGVGRGLIAATQAALGPNAKLILLSAPGAVEYYPKLGFDAHPSAWWIGSRTPLR